VKRILRVVKLLTPVLFFSLSQLRQCAKRAKTYYGKLMTLCRQADSVRPEIEEAKAFLAGVNVKDFASAK
jgi:hypothetical protein